MSENETFLWGDGLINLGKILNNSVFSHVDTIISPEIPGNRYIITVYNFLDTWNGKPERGWEKLCARLMKNLAKDGKFRQLLAKVPLFDNAL
jgi:hypothetical protein